MSTGRFWILRRFVRTNVEGTRCLLEAARRHKVSRFVQISTDEVYGSLGSTGSFARDTPIDPSEPILGQQSRGRFARSGVLQDHRLPAVITRCSNNYGPYQFPEKLHPGSDYECDGRPAAADLRRRTERSRMDFRR